MSIITMNAPIKGHGVADWLKIQVSTMLCCQQETPLRAKDIYKLKVRGWKKICKWKRQESWILYTHNRQNRL